MTGSGAVRDDVLAAARSISGVVREHADEGERIRRLPAPAVDAIVRAGLARLCVPTAYGGPGVDPMTMVEAIEAVASDDGAAGWCAMIAATTSSLAAFLEPRTAAEVYGDPAVVTGGVFAPNGTFTPTTTSDGDDAVRVTGRWQWGSGTQHCRWIVGGARGDDAFRLCWYDAADVTFHDTWYTSGMRGSGSLDFSVDGAVVPLRRTMQPGITRPFVDEPLSRFPNFTLLATGVAAVGLGVARRALDELIALAGEKTPQFATRTLASSPYTQIEVARAEASLRSARAFLLDELSTGWDRASAGGAVSVESRAAIRLAALHAAEVSTTVADTAFVLAGGTAVYDTSVLGRCLRDAHVVTQHIMTAPKLSETLGKVILGVDAETTML